MKRYHGSRDRVCLCGAVVDALSMPEVVGQIERAIEARSPLNISVVNVAKLVNMCQDALLRESVLSGELVLADGMPLVWLSRLRGQPLPERVAGIDLMFRMFELADRRNSRVFLLGATQQVIEQVVAIVQERYPGMTVAGFRNGYFSDSQQEEVAREIGASHADILLVAMTSPKKELFMKRWGARMGVPVVHGVGGSFDVMAGVTKRAPGWMQRCGLEWLYRVLQEPGRLWKRYLWTNARFVWLAPRCVLCSGDAPALTGCSWGRQGQEND